MALKQSITITLAHKSKKTGHKQKARKNLSKDELLFEQIVSEVVGLDKEPIIIRIISKLKENRKISNFWFSLKFTGEHRPLPRFSSLPSREERVPQSRLGAQGGGATDGSK